VAGGTGSGTFLDIAFMARDIIGSDEQSNFTGVLLLPGIFTRYAGVALVKLFTREDYLEAHRAHNWRPRRVMFE